MLPAPNSIRNNCVCARATVWNFKCNLRKVVCVCVVDIFLFEYTSTLLSLFFNILTYWLTDWLTERIIGTWFVQFVHYMSE